MELNKLTKSELIESIRIKEDILDNIINQVKDLRFENYLLKKQIKIDLKTSTLKTLKAIKTLKDL